MVIARVLSQNAIPKGVAFFYGEMENVMSNLKKLPILKRSQ
jgi:hypothetical protein